MAALPSPIRWAAGQVVTAADRNAHINAVLDGLAGRSGTIELEDSLAILDGSGNRYIRLPASTASAGERAQMRYDATNGRLQYHDGSSWQTVWATTAVDLFAALLAVGDVGPGSEQVARGNHVHSGVAPPPPTPFVPDLVLGIDDFDQTGLDTPIVLALLTATISGNDFTAEGVVPDEGSLVVNDLTIDHMERHSNGASIRLRKRGTGFLSTYFRTIGVPTYPTAKLYIQVLVAGAHVVVPFTLGTSGGGYANWAVDTAAQATVVNGFSTGDKFLLAIAEPS